MKRVKKLAENDLRRFQGKIITTLFQVSSSSFVLNRQILLKLIRKKERYFCSEVKNSSEWITLLELEFLIHPPGFEKAFRLFEPS